MRHQACELASREATAFSFSGHVEYLRGKDWISVCKDIGLDRPHYSSLCVLKNVHSGEQITKVTDSHADSPRYVWTKGESAKTKLQIQKYIFRNLWSGP